MERVTEEEFKTIAIDISDSVFQNESTAMMYITKDKYASSYIVSVPVENFSCNIMSNEDYEFLLTLNHFGDRPKRERLVQAIKESMPQFYE